LHIDAAFQFIIGIRGQKKKIVLAKHIKLSIVQKTLHAIWYMKYWLRHTFQVTISLSSKSYYYFFVLNRGGARGDSLLQFWTIDFHHLIACIDKYGWVVSFHFIIIITRGKTIMGRITLLPSKFHIINHIFFLGKPRIKSNTEFRS